MKVYSYVEEFKSLLVKIDLLIKIMTIFTLVVGILAGLLSAMSAGDVMLAVPPIIVTIIFCFIIHVSRILGLGVTWTILSISDSLKTLAEQPRTPSSQGNLSLEQVQNLIREETKQAVQRDREQEKAKRMAAEAKQKALEALKKAKDNS